jgi:hypothetical protein
VRKRDETSSAIVEAARQLFARWGPRGKDAGLIVVVNPVGRLFYRRWMIVEGLDLRVACRRNPPPEGLILGGHQSFLNAVRERRPFSADWTVMQDVESAVATINRQLTKWTGTSV